MSKWATDKKCAKCAKWVRVETDGSLGYHVGRNGAKCVSTEAVVKKVDTTKTNETVTAMLRAQFGI